MSVTNGDKTAYMDIDKDGKDDMFVSISWTYNPGSATFSDSAMIGFLGAFQGEFALSDRYLAKFDSGHQITDADFNTIYRSDGAHLWIAQWDSDGTPVPYDPMNRDGYYDFSYYSLFVDSPSPVTATPTTRLWAEGLWQNVGDTGYAVFRQAVDGGQRYGWVQLTHGSVDVGMLGFTDTVGEIPEPGTLALTLAGLGVLGASRRRARNSRAANI